MRDMVLEIMAGGFKSRDLTDILPLLTLFYCFRPSRFDRSCLSWLPLVPHTGNCLAVNFTRARFLNLAFFFSSPFQATSTGLTLLSLR